MAENQDAYNPDKEFEISDIEKENPLQFENQDQNNENLKLNESFENLSV